MLKVQSQSPYTPLSMQLVHQSTCLLLNCACADAWARASAQPILHDVISTRGRVVRNLVFHERKKQCGKKKNIGRK